MRKVIKSLNTTREYLYIITSIWKNKNGLNFITKSFSQVDDILADMDISDWVTFLTSLDSCSASKDVHGEFMDCTA